MMSLLAYERNKPNAALQPPVLFRLWISKNMDAFASAGDTTVDARC